MSAAQASGLNAWVRAQTSPGDQDENGSGCGPLTMTLGSGSGSIRPPVTRCRRPWNTQLTVASGEAGK